jgi:hypothetical protein
VDLFAPPAAAAADVVELADDEIAHRARKRMTAPPVAAPEPLRSAPSSSVAPHPAGRSAPADPVPPAPGDPAGSPLPRTVSTPLLAPRPSPAAAAGPPAAVRLAAPRLLASPRARLAIGVLLAIVLGFLPADLVASARERSALRAIDARVIAKQDAADSQDSYDALDAFRADQLQAKRSKRRMIVLTSILIWGAASGAFGYVWFRHIRWERFDRAR